MSRLSSQGLPYSVVRAVTDPIENLRSAHYRIMVALLEARDDEEICQAIHLALSLIISLRSPITARHILSRDTIQDWLWFNWDTAAARFWSEFLDALYALIGFLTTRPQLPLTAHSRRMLTEGMVIYGGDGDLDSLIEIQRHRYSR